MRYESKFQIVAYPTLRNAVDKPAQLDFVEFTATREEEVRSWIVDGTELSSLTEILAIDANRYIRDLRLGKPVTLPESYDAGHLVLLGFRRAPRSVPIRARRNANA